jgi:hypothetical protein
VVLGLLVLRQNGYAPARWTGEWGRVKNCDEPFQDRRGGFSHHKSQHLRKKRGAATQEVSKVHRRLKVSRGAIWVERGLHTLRRQARAERKLRDDIAVAESDISVLSSELTRTARSDAEDA